MQVASGTGDPHFMIISPQGTYMCFDTWSGFSGKTFNILTEKNTGMCNHNEITAGLACRDAFVHNSLYVDLQSTYIVKTWVML